MGKSKIDMFSNLMAFKRECRLIKWDHIVLKNHKIALCKCRFDFKHNITSIKITENMMVKLSQIFNVRDINIAKYAEQ